MCTGVIHPHLMASYQELPQVGQNCQNVRIEKATIVIEPQGKKAWLKQQILQINVANVILLILAFYISTTVKSTLQQQEQALQSQRDVLAESALALASLKAETSEAIFILQGIQNKSDDLEKQFNETERLLQQAIQDYNLSQIIDLSQAFSLTYETALIESMRQGATALCAHLEGGKSSRTTSVLSKVAGVHCNATCAEIDTECLALTSQSTGNPPVTPSTPLSPALGGERVGGGYIYSCVVAGLIAEHGERVSAAGGVGFYCCCR